MAVSKHVEHLMEEHMNIARSIAARVHRTAPQALDKDELEGYAFEGLVEAANNWDSYCAERGFDPTAVQFFTPYSQRRMHGNIYDNLRSADWATRSVRTLSRQIQQADQGMGLSESEIAKRTGLSLKDVHTTNAKMARKPISFDSGISEMYEPRATDVASTAESDALLGVAVDAIRDCTYDQQIVLALHYYEEMDLRDVAKKMGIPEQLASKLHTAAVMAVYETMKLSAEDD